MAALAPVMDDPVVGFRYPARAAGATNHVAMWKHEAKVGVLGEDVIRTLPLVESRDLTQAVIGLVRKASDQSVGFVVDPKSGLGPAVFLAVRHSRTVYGSPVFGRSSLYSRIVYHDKHKDVKESDVATLLRVGDAGSSSPSPSPSRSPSLKPKAAVFMVTTRPPAEVLSGDTGAAVQAGLVGLDVHPVAPCLEVPETLALAADPDVVQHLTDTLYLWLRDSARHVGQPEEVVLVLCCPQIPELAAAFGLAMCHVRCDFRQALRTLTVVTPTETTEYRVYA